MSRETIRDVVIRINIEQGNSTLSMLAFDTVRTQSDSAQKSIVEMTRALQLFQSTTAKKTTSTFSLAGFASLKSVSTQNRFPDHLIGLPNASAPATNAPLMLRNSNSLMPSPGNAGLRQITEASTQLARLKSTALGAAQANQALGNATTNLAPQLANVAANTQTVNVAFGFAMTSVKEITEATVAAGPKFSLWGTLLKAGLKLYSEALKQTRDETRDYWREIAEDAQTAVAQQQRAISRRVEHGQRRLDAQSIDITDSQLAPRQIKAQAQREALIRQEQAKIADRPLAERQEIRDRIERRGAHQDQRDAIQARIDHLEQHKSRIVAEKQRLQGDFDKADQLQKGLEKPREQSRVRASEFGVAAKTALASAGLSEKWLPEQVISAVGGTTTRDEKEDFFFRKQTEMRSAADAANAKRSVANGIVNLSQDELNTNQQIIALKQQKHGVTVSEQREARMIAEQGRESLTDKMLKFGSADEGTKASLREIQHKADQGIELNHLEKQLAESYGIGASHQARKQSLDSAMLPENAKLFAHDIELQKQREQDAKAAESQPVKDEQNELVDQIGKLSEDTKQGTDRLLAALEQAFNVNHLIDKISGQLEAQATELQRLEIKLNRNWFY